jgi:hypothetical protein
VTRLTNRIAILKQYHEAFGPAHATATGQKHGYGRQTMRDTLISRFLVLLLIWMLALTPLFFM